MASPKSVNILDICMVGAAHDSKSGTDTTLEFSPTFFELEYFRLPTSSCLFFFKLTDSNPSFFHSVIIPKLRQSLSHTLLRFLPIVSCLTWPPHSSRPIFAYNSSNDAVSFTVAESDDDFDRLAGNGIREAADSHPYSPQLLATETKAPLLALQVTLFRNKGFCIGMETHHAMFDGKSASMFFRAWAYTCKYIVEKGEAPLLFPEDITPSFDWSTIKDSEGLEEVYLNLWVSMGKKLDSGLESNPRSVKPFSKLDVQPNLLRATFHLTTEDIKKLRESVLNYHHPAETDPTERLNFSTYVLACSYASVCQVKAVEFLDLCLLLLYFAGCVCLGEKGKSFESWVFRNCRVKAAEAAFGAGVSSSSESLSELSSSSLFFGTFLGAEAFAGISSSSEDSSSEES